MKKEKNKNIRNKKTKPPFYRAGVNVLHIENESHVLSDFRGTLLKNNIYVYQTDNLYDAQKIIEKFDVDLIVSDGMFPTKKGEVEKKNFIPLVNFLRREEIPASIIAWSNSTHVHEFCKKEKVPHYSKMALTRDRFKEKKRRYIEVQIKLPEEMAKTVIEILYKNFGLYDVLKVSRFNLYYQEPATVLGAFLGSDMRTSMFEKTAGLNYGAMIVEIKNSLFSIYVDQSNDKKISDLIYQKILKENFFPSIKKEINLRAKRLLSFSRSLKSFDYSNYSNEKLERLYLKFVRLFMEMRIYSSLPTAMEHISNVWTEFLTEILSKRIKDREEINTTFVTLTSPEKTSYLNEYEVEVAKLGLKKYSEKDVSSGVKKILNRFTWIHYTFEGIPITKKEILSKIKNLGKSRKDFEFFLDNQKKRLIQIKKEKNRLRKEYNLSKQEVEWFEIGADIVFIKYFRKGVFAESYYNVEFLLKEIARRLRLSHRQVVNMLANEVLAALKLGDFPSHLIEGRMKESSLLCYNGRSFPLDSGAKELYKKAVVVEKEEVEIKGQVAFVGFAKGKVRIVNISSDMEKMKDGEVLVSRSTNPSLVTAMRKAVAFVTDIGGLTCHAAIVAREMQKPCIVGTKSATQILKDGDLVEVDANNGLVRIINEI